MLLLADSLRRISKRHRTPGGEGLALQVGLHCGEVAGALVGAHRRFYCLYGDAVNTAARMCKHAGASIHCSAAFAQAVRDLGCDSFACSSRGLVDIKGKGPVETFDVTISPAASTVGSDPLTGARQPAANVHDRDGAPDGGRPAAAGSSGSFRLGRPPDPRYAIRSLVPVFADPLVEADFRLWHVRDSRRQLVAALLLHLLAVGKQLLGLLYPEYDYDFGALGSEALATGKRRARLILCAHAALATAASTLLAAAVWRAGEPGGSPVRWDRHLVALNGAFLAASLAACCQLPAMRLWLIFFPAAMVCCGTWVGMMAPLPACVLSVAAVVGACLAMGLLDVFSSPAAINLVGVLVFTLAGTRLTNWNRRALWRAQVAHEGEVQRLRGTLFDLFPREVAQRMLQGGLAEAQHCRRCRAAVLQLDICGFTRMSQEMSALEVAEMMDRCVPNRPLYGTRGWAVTVSASYLYFIRA